MAQSDFNPNFKSKHVAPHAGNDGTTEFPMEELMRRLDGEPEPKDESIDSTQPDAAQVMQMLLQWIGTCKARDPRAINYIGKRAIAALWVIKPEMFGDAPAQMVAKSFGISPLKFYHVTAEFSRSFGVRNRFQVHDWQNKK